MEIDWKSVRKVLVVRLRSIGDTVLSTPTLRVLRENLPDARIDILLEDWVAPVLEGFEEVDNVIPVPKSTGGRIKAALRLRNTRYDVAINLHGGTTAGFMTRATGARHRIGYEGYQYSFLYNNRYPSPTIYWNKEILHSAERQLALLGFAGIPVEKCPRTKLKVNENALKSVDEKLAAVFADNVPERIGLIHPAAAYDTKRWPEQNFALLAGYLEDLGIQPLFVVSSSERWVVDRIERCCDRKVNALSELSLPEVAALASTMECFVGNDSGIAHIAAAVGTPSVVIFGSSDVNNWRPFTDAPNGIVKNTLECQPCPGDRCRVYGDPKCINEVPTDMVFAELGRVLGYS